MSDAQQEPKRSTPKPRLLVELGPLIVFYAFYFKGDLFLENEGKEIFYATGAFMAAFAVALAYSLYKDRRVSPTLLISGVIIFIFGGLALILQNQTFIYMKTTIINATLAIILAVGAFTGRLFLKMLFSHAFELPPQGWRSLTWRFVGFYAFLGILNEIVWRNFSEPVWVNYKTFGVLPLTIAFMALQIPFLLKHGEAAEEMPPPSGPEDSSEAENPSARLSDDSDATPNERSETQDRSTESPPTSQA